MIENDLALIRASQREQPEAWIERFMLHGVPYIIDQTVVTDGTRDISSLIQFTFMGQPCIGLRDPLEPLLGDNQCIVFEYPGCWILIPPTGLSIEWIVTWQDWNSEVIVALPGIPILEMHEDDSATAGWASKLVGEIIHALELDRLVPPFDV